MARLILVVAVSLALFSVSAAAGSGGPVIYGYPYYYSACPAAGRAKVVDHYGMFACNCTSYAAWALKANGQRVDWFVAGRMDARNWPNAARAAGIPLGSRPRIGALAVWPRAAPPYGHIAYVTALHGRLFDVAEYNHGGTFLFGRRYGLEAAGVTFIYVPRA